jgi:hypothetical protein
MEHLSFDQFNQADIVDFLASIGVQPIKRSGYRYYYPSPLSPHATLTVNRKQNRWRDSASGQTGNLTDLAVHLYDCTISELTTRLSAALPVTHPPTTHPSIPPENIRIDDIHPIRSLYLDQYLWQQRISPHVAHHYCREAWYIHEHRTFNALAFHNNAGGVELFNRHHHYRTGPCGPTLITRHSPSLAPCNPDPISGYSSSIAPCSPDLIPRHYPSVTPCNSSPITRHSSSVAIFRDLFDCLSFATILHGSAQPLPDFLVLNAHIPFPAIHQQLQPYRHLHLFLPNDDAGKAFVRLARRSFPDCQDNSPLYAHYPTLHAWTCCIGTAATPAKSPPDNPSPPQPSPPKTTPPRQGWQDDYM